MKETVPKSGMVRSVKAFTYSTALFFILLLIFNSLVAFTGVSERWTGICALIALAVSGMFSGLFGGSIVKKRGYVCGAGYAAVTLLCVLLAAYYASGGEGAVNLLQLRYLICLAAGSIGGMIGVNLNI